jgi:ribokinase
VAPAATREELVADAEVTYTAWGVGICPFDSAYLLKRWPKPGEKVDAVAAVHGGGGPVPTAMATLTHLGDRAAFVGVVGDDEAGRRILEDLERRGVDVSGIQVAPGCQSPTAALWVEEGTGRRTAVFHPGTVPPPEPVSDEWLARHPARFLLLDARAFLKAGREGWRARERGTEVVVDIGSPRQPDPEAWSSAQHLVVSMEFARWRTGRSDPEGAAERLWRPDLKSLVITMGPRGAYLYTPEASLFQPAFRVPVVDVTGAGDVFHGAYLYALARPWSWYERLRFASAAAALACRGLGVRASLPSLAEIQELLECEERDAEGAPG